MTSQKYSEIHKIFLNYKKTEKRHDYPYLSVPLSIYSLSYCDGWTHGKVQATAMHGKLVRCRSEDGARALTLVAEKDGVDIGTDSNLPGAPV